MPVPALGWALIAGFGLLVAACRREEKESSKPLHPPKPNCPEGWSQIDFEEGKTPTRICHRDSLGAPDGIYQKKTDQLGVLWEDRFIPSTDPQFPSSWEKLYLPSWEGIHLAQWNKAYQALFPQLATLRSFCHKKDIDFAEMRRIANKVGPLDSGLSTVRRTSPGITPMERIQALTLVTTLMALQKDTTGFYRDNQKFIDTVLRLIAEGKFKIRDWLGQNAKTLGETREFIIYSPWANGMDISMPLDPRRNNSTASMLHELYHFYQDYQKTPGSILDIEMGAYLKFSEYLVAVFEQGKRQGRYREEADFFKELFPHPADAADHPYALAFRAAYFQKTGDQTRSDEQREKLKVAINANYYLGSIFSQAAVEAAKTPLLNEAYRPQMQQTELKKSRQRIAALSAEKASALGELKTMHRAVPKKDSTFLDRLKKQYGKVAALWLRLILNQKFQEEVLANGNPQKINIDPRGPREKEMLETLGRLNPLGLVPAGTDGVE
jgi:hypothetical protein